MFFNLFIMFLRNVLSQFFIVEYCTIHFNMRVQNPVITTVMVEAFVSTCAAERSFSSMKRLKTPLRNTLNKERLSSLAILHIRKHKNDNLVSEFSLRKGRRLALFLSPHLQFTLISVVLKPDK